MNEMLMPGRRMLCRVIGSAIIVAVTTVGSHLAAAAEAQVTIDNFKFSPTPLKVPVGTTVTWVNRDDIPHTIVCPALNVRSHPLDTDDHFSYQFKQAGTYDYFCGIHPFMRGQVVVS
jgi:amicyanin